MAPEHYIYLLIMLIIMPKGLSQLVKTQRVVIVTLGEDAHLSCSLMEPKDVLQVTWQRETPRGIENVASYNKRFGTLVNSRFQKVVFQDMGLEKCSIIIREASREDEGCYRCLFNSNPDGAVIGRTCLQVNELYGPTLLVTQTNDSHTLFSGLTVSCSATGQPAPIVAWNVTKQFLEKSSTVSVNHRNGTVTVTITSAMLVPSVDTMVGCVVSSGKVTKVVSKEIPANSSSFTGMMVGVGMCSVGVIVFICGLVWCLFMRRHQKSRGKTGQDAAEIREIRSSRSPIQNQEKDNGSVMIPQKQTTQQDDAVIRVPLIKETPEKHLEKQSGSLMTPCGVVEEGRVGQGEASSVRKRTKKWYVHPETQCKKQLKFK